METYYKIFYYVMLAAFIGSCIYLYTDAVKYSQTNKNEDK
jgi:hypothetical protein